MELLGLNWTGPTSGIAAPEFCDKKGTVGPSDCQCSAQSSFNSEVARALRKVIELVGKGFGIAAAVSPSAFGALCGR
jgi:hypothetical protein